MISRSLIPYLDDIESRLDPQQEEQLLREWVDFSASGSPSPIFSPTRAHPCPPRIDWPKVAVNPALTDFDLMALQQFGAVSGLLAGGSGQLPAVRCNYGSSILPSLFGVEMFMMDDALDTLPTSRPLNDLAAIQRILDGGVPAPNAGWGERTLRMGEIYAEITARYPKIGRYVFVYHPDTQGPMDVCEVLWGSTIFYALYDQPHLVHALLELVTVTYIHFLRAWEKIIPFKEAGNCHWGLYHRGKIMLRDDSAMNLSPAMFDAFVRPYDQRLLDEFGGGAIHFCGKGDHYIRSMGQMRGLHAINMSQPHLNQMEKIYTNTVDRGIRIIGFDRAAAEAARKAGRDLRGFMHAP